MCSASTSKTLQTARSCSSSVLVKIRMSSKYTTMIPSAMRVLKISFYHSLEGGGAVGHSKEHHEGFKEAAIGAEDRLLFISGLDAHIVEPPPDVKFCKVPGSTELGDKFGDEGEKIPVFDGHSVQRAIVLD